MITGFAFFGLRAGGFPCGTADDCAEIPDDLFLILATTDEKLKHHQEQWWPPRVAVRLRGR